VIYRLFFFVPIQYSMAFSGLIDSATGKIAAQYLPPSGGGGGGVVALFDADVNLIPVSKPAVSIVGNISYTPSASGVAVITGTAQVSFTSLGSGNSCAMWLYQDGAQIQDEIDTSDQYSDQERSMTQQGAVNVSAGVPIILSLAFNHGGPDAGSAVVEAWSISVITPPPS
jgi:hypothetical protein